jgi:3-mercaptopyruvate sulfurtransferase SseA
MFHPFALLMVGEPTPQALGDWIHRPEFQIPLGFGVVLLLVLLIIRLPEIRSWWRARNKQVLEPIEVEALLHGKAPTVVDLRPSEAFNGPKGHIRGAYNIPPAVLSLHIGEVAKDRRQLVVLVDDDDRISHLVAPLLASGGYSWVRVLKGGMRAWLRAELPVSARGQGN